MKKLIVITLGIFLSLYVIKSALAFDDGDWQLWSRVTLQGTLSERCKISLDEEFRGGDDMSDLYFHRTDLGVTYKFMNWCYVGLNYWHSYKEKNGQWYQEKRPHINLTFKLKLQNFKFENRNRFENRNCQGEDAYWRYRNRLTISPPVKFTSHDIRPYLADEIFYDFEENEFHRNRIYAGLKMKLQKNIGFDI